MTQVIPLRDVFTPESLPATARKSGRQRSLSILYLCHRVPYPPDKGDKIRAFNQIRALSAHHSVHLLTLADGPVPDLSGLSELCSAVEVFPISRSAGLLRSALALPGRRPLTLSFFASRALERRVAKLVAEKRFDVVVAYSSSMVPFADLAGDVPRVLDMVDVDSAKWAQYARFGPLPLRPVYALEARRLRRYEAATAERFAKVVLATGNEAADFRALATSVPNPPAVAIANGIDLDYFRPLDLPKAQRPTLVFTGQMDYFANVDGIVRFTQKVLPRLRTRFPEIQLLIVGRSPSKPVRALAELPGVHVTGAVGDVRPFLARSWVFVAPLRIARGVQNKVLEAMASSLPVVCSERVLAGLSEGGFVNGRDLLASGDDAGMEQAIAKLLEDADLRQKMADAARGRLAEAYGWATNLGCFEELLLEVASINGPRSLERPATSAMSATSATSAVAAVAVEAARVERREAEARSA
jgi:sugar transferase (PEP-CTERM/EpsH1 system associated)